MKTKYFYAFLLFVGLSYQKVIAQESTPDTIEIKLEKQQGVGPFNAGMTMAGSRSDESHPYFKAQPEPIELPEDMANYKQYYIIPNFIQFVYQSANEGLIEESYWKGIETRYDGEEIISQLSKSPIRTFIRLASASDADGNINIWVDMNANDQVDPGEIHHYSTSLKGSPSLYSGENSFEVSYEKFVNGKVVNVQIQLNLNPFGYQDNILYNFSEYKKGEIKTDTASFDIYLSNGGTSDYFVKEQINVFFHDDPRSFQDIPYEEKEYLQYQEVIFINGIKYKIGKTSVDGSTLTLIKYPEDQEWIGTQIGAKAVPINSVALDSIPYNLYNGKITMLDFWGSWCGPCVAEIPFLKDAAGFFEGDQFELVGIIFDTRKTVEAFIEKNNVFWKQVMHQYDKSDSVDISKAYGISGYPTTYLIDQNNQVVIKNKGLRSYQLYKTLSKYLNRDEGDFLKYITQGDFIISIDHSDKKISSPYATIGESTDKYYAYPIDGHYQRGFNFGDNQEEIDLVLNYSDENRQLIKKEVKIKKTDLVAGKFTVKL